MICFEIDFHYVTQSGSKLTILLPQFPKFWDYRNLLSIAVINTMIKNNLGRKGSI